MFVFVPGKSILKLDNRNISGVVSLDDVTRDGSLSLVC